ncbi:MaoC/PaaZ C-terminal domain-containing protein [Amycolatopsis sp. GM8]|uniref:MaoC/PaaZ C-terminal domain-containing protein n=1 Tax=Amycolatopsis sp. GM8 TaxID=2896530 RepID=UPI001F3F9CFC|nr:MaoC/PaaZ C-terminal domain-containing protein [Amycolatopsis sp. GM8]
MTSVCPSACALLDAAGTGSSRWILVDQARVDAFADITQDRQSIHIDPVRAATGPFGVRRSRTNI